MDLTVEGEDEFSEREPGGTYGDRRCTSAGNRLFFGSGLTTSDRGWGWRCQAYFWECTDLITIELAV